MAGEWDHLDAILAPKPAGEWDHLDAILAPKATPEQAQHIQDSVQGMTLQFTPEQTPAPSTPAVSRVGADLPAAGGGVEAAATPAQPSGATGLERVSDYLQGTARKAVDIPGGMAQQAWDNPGWTTAGALLGGTLGGPGGAVLGAGLAPGLAHLGSSAMRAVGGDDVPNPSLGMTGQRSTTGMDVAGEAVGMLPGVSNLYRNVQEKGLVGGIDAFLADGGALDVAMLYGLAKHGYAKTPWAAEEAARAAMQQRMGRVSELTSQPAHAKFGDVPMAPALGGRPMAQGNTGGSSVTGPQLGPIAAGDVGSIRDPQFNPGEGISRGRPGYIEQPGADSVGRLFASRNGVALDPAAGSFDQSTHPSPVIGQAPMDANGLPTTSFPPTRPHLADPMPGELKGNMLHARGEPLPPPSALPSQPVRGDIFRPNQTPVDPTFDGTIPPSGRRLVGDFGKPPSNVIGQPVPGEPQFDGSLPPTGLPLNQRFAEPPVNVEDLSWKIGGKDVAARTNVPAQPATAAAPSPGSEYGVGKPGAPAMVDLSGDGTYPYEPGPTTPMDAAMSRKTQRGIIGPRAQVGADEPMIPRDKLSRLSTELDPNPGRNRGLFDWFRPATHPGSILGVSANVLREIGDNPQLGGTGIGVYGKAANAMRDFAQGKIAERLGGQELSQLTDGQAKLLARVANGSALPLDVDIAQKSPVMGPLLKRWNQFKLEIDQNPALETKVKDVKDFREAVSEYSRAVANDLHIKPFEQAVEALKKATGEDGKPLLNKDTHDLIDAYVNHAIKGLPTEMEKSINAGAWANGIKDGINYGIRNLGLKKLGASELNVPTDMMGAVTKATAAGVTSPFSVLKAHGLGDWINNTLESGPLNATGQMLRGASERMKLIATQDPATWDMLKRNGVISPLWEQGANPTVMQGLSQAGQHALAWATMVDQASALGKFMQMRESFLKQGMSPANAEAAASIVNDAYRYNPSRATSGPYLASQLSSLGALFMKPTINTVSNFHQWLASDGTGIRGQQLRALGAVGSAIIGGMMGVKTLNALHLHGYTGPATGHVVSEAMQGRPPGRIKRAYEAASEGRFGEAVTGMPMGGF